MDDDAYKEVDLQIGGQKIRAKGYRLVDLAIFLILAGLAFLVYMLRDHIEMSKEVEKRTIGVLEKQVETQNEMNYILTLTPEERARLNLSMPYSLRAKIENRRWDTK